VWEIKNPTIQKSELDFTSSEQGFCEVSRLVADGVVLMNAIELMEFDEDEVQLLICNQCGVVRCQSGNWVNFRKSGDFILLIPAFEMMEGDAWSRTEYAPPQYFKKQGTPYFEPETYENLRRRISRFPAIEKIKTLEMGEAMRLAQDKMPLRIFGEPPEINVRPDKFGYIIAASDGEPEENLQKIEEILRQNYKNSSPAKIRPAAAAEDEEIIHLFVDAFEFTGWQALVKNSSGYKLLLEEKFVIEEANK
jgi:hypothetical protein